MLGGIQTFLTLQMNPFLQYFLVLQSIKTTYWPMMYFFWAAFTLAEFPSTSVEYHKSGFKCSLTKNKQF